jgi:anti-sigma regulatory factor (Ser/Thr protein kinase)
MGSWQREEPAIINRSIQPASAPESGAHPESLPPPPGQGEWPFRSYLELVALASAPSRARRHLKATLDEWGLQDLAEDAEVALSELATNALTAPQAHDESPAVIRLSLLGDTGRLVVEVWDGSPFPPVLTCAPATAERGRGVWLVAELSSNWGWYKRPGTGGKCVWAEFRKPSPGEQP